MVHLLFILILLQSLASSMSSMYVMKLVISRENKLVSNNEQTLLVLNEPFRIQIYSETSLVSLLCLNKQSNNLLFSKTFTNLNDHANLYTFPNNFFARKAMNGTWKCKLYSSPNASILFEKNVVVRASYHPKVKPASGSYGFVQNTSTAAKINSTEDLNANLNIKTSRHTEIQEGATTPELENNANENASNQNTWMIVISIVIAVSGIVLGLIAAAVCSKMCRRKTLTEEPSLSVDGGSLSNPVYDELYATINEEPPAIDIAKRSPYPLPFQEEEDSKANAHYASPYDHRIPIKKILRLTDFEERQS